MPQHIFCNYFNNITIISFMANTLCTALGQFNDTSQVICKVVFIHNSNIVEEYRFRSSLFKAIYTCLMLKG